VVAQPFDRARLFPLSNFESLEHFESHFESRVLLFAFSFVLAIAVFR
jgi:hypothetical protein